MREEFNEIIEGKDENEKIEKKSKASIIVPIIVAVLAFVLVYGGFMVVEHFKGDNNTLENENTEKEEEQEEQESNSDESVVDENQGMGGTTGEEIPITITDAMKSELNNIASIRDRYCSTEKLFYSMNGFLKDLPVEKKKFIVVDYYLLNNIGATTISETSYKEIAAKYEFTESFDTIFAGAEKSGNDYVLPPMGCVGVERVSHNTTYQDTGNTITVIDNVTITNQETNVSENIKVIYTFIYTGEGNNITFRLHQVNHEKQ